MKIEINEKPNKNFYDEFLSVSIKYRKILKNPNIKIKKITRELIKLIIMALLTLIFLIVSYVYFKDTLFMFLTGIIFLLLIYTVMYYIAINKRIKLFENDKSKSVINIDLDGIELIKENSQDVKLNWEQIKFILINKETICLIPKNPSFIMIALNTEYKDEFLEGVYKYNKENLIVDNTNLYTK